MFRKIHFFGCSYTYGAGLPNRFKERYSYHLARHFGAPSRNYATPGGSDHLTLSKLVHLQCHNYITSDDLVVIQWTQPNRHPIPLASEKAEFLADASYVYNTTEHLVNYPFIEMGSLNKLRREQKYFLQNYIALVNPEAHFRFNNQVLKELTDGWLTSRGIQSIQFYSHQFNGTIPVFSTMTQDVMQDFLDNHGLTSNLPCGHPSAEAHKRWANHLYYLHQHRFKNQLI